MIHIAEIRADAQAAPGDGVVLTKEQLFQLLDEIDTGYRAIRALRIQEAVNEAVGIDRVSGPFRQPEMPDL